MKALETNETWENVERQGGKKSVGLSGSIWSSTNQMILLIYTKQYYQNKNKLTPMSPTRRRRLLQWQRRTVMSKNALLHGDLEEEMYFKTLPGFNIKN